MDGGPVNNDLWRRRIIVRWGCNADGIKSTRGTSRDKPQRVPAGRGLVAEAAASNRAVEGRIAWHGPWANPAACLTALKRIIERGGGGMDALGASVWLPKKCPGTFCMVRVRVATVCFLAACRQAGAFGRALGRGPRPRLRRAAGALPARARIGLWETAQVANPCGRGKAGPGKEGRQEPMAIMLSMWGVRLISGVWVPLGVGPRTPLGLSGNPRIGGHNV